MFHHRIVRANRGRSLGDSGLSAPLSATIITVSMLTITAGVALASLVTLNAGSDPSYRTAASVAELHRAVESLWFSSPGSSLTVFTSSSEPISISRSSISFGSASLSVSDHAGIVTHCSCGVIAYDVSKISFTPATIPPGVCKVVIKVCVSYISKIIQVEVVSK